MFCQNALLFKFVFSVGNKDDYVEKISLTIEATDKILVLVVKWHHRTNGLLEEELLQM